MKGELKLLVVDPTEKETEAVMKDGASAPKGLMRTEYRPYEQKGQDRTGGRAVGGYATVKTMQLPCLVV